jgi:NAD(P)-dependent dehydrogenase (short-subunit alcohol dehydrogenase family)
MVQDGGGVIEFFDSLNSVADLGQFFYTTGKAPLSKWCRLISREFGQFGVRTYNLVIGTTPSKKLSWLKRFLEMVGLEKSLAWLFDTRRLGTPDDVAEMAINLATHNYWMSGTSIDLHGGYCGVNLTEDDDFRGTTHKLYQLLHGDEINPTHVVDAGGDAYAI